MAVNYVDRRPGFTMVYNDDMVAILEKCGKDAFAVYMVMAKFANRKTSRCHPSLRTLSGIVGSSESTVRRSIRSLAEHGFLSVEANHDEDGRQTSNMYHVLSPVLSTPPVTSGTLPLSPETDKQEPVEQEKPVSSETGVTATGDDETNGHASNPAWEVWTAYCDGRGLDPKHLTGRPLGKQLAVAKRVADDWTKEHVYWLAHELARDPFWQKQSWDMFTIEKRLPGWSAGQKSARPVEAAGGVAL